MPNIIWNMGYKATEYCHNSNFLKSAVSLKEAITYYDRDEAVDKTSIVSMKDAMNYYNFRIGSSGGFGPNGDLTRKEIDELIDADRPEFIYRSVLSFDPKYAEEKGLTNKSSMYMLLKKTIPSVMKQMDLENGEWLAFYHTNTEHPHLHIIMYDKQNKIMQPYLQKNKFRKLRNHFYRELEDNTVLFIEKDKRKKELVDFIKKEYQWDTSFLSKMQSELNNSFIEEFIQLEKKLPKKGSLKLGSSNIAPFREEIAQLLIQLREDPHVKKLYEAYEKSLELQADILEKNYGKSFDREAFLFDNLHRLEDKLVFDDKTGELRKQKIHSLDGRLANLMLANIKNFRKDKEVIKNEFVMPVKNEKKVVEKGDNLNEGTVKDTDKDLIVLPVEKKNDLLLTQTENPENKSISSISSKDKSDVMKDLYLEKREYKRQQQYTNELQRNVQRRVQVMKYGYLQEIGYSIFKTYCSVLSERIRALDVFYEAKMNLEKQREVQMNEMRF